MSALAAPKRPRFADLPIDLQSDFLWRLRQADEIVKLTKKADQWEKEHGFKNALKLTGLILALGPFGIAAALLVFENPYQRQLERIMRHKQRMKAARAKASGPTRPAQARRPAPARATLAA